MRDFNRESKGGLDLANLMLPCPRKLPEALPAQAQDSTSLTPDESWTCLPRSEAGCADWVRPVLGAE